MGKHVGTFVLPGIAGANPGTPTGGQLFYDQDDNTFRGWNGTTWVDLGAGGGSGSPGGAAGDVQYNDGAGGFGGETAFDYDAATNQLSVPGLSVAEDILFPGNITPTQITADQNDYAPTNFAIATVLRLSADSPFRAITGLAGGAEGRFVVLRNIGTRIIQLKKESASSTAANRFALQSDYRIEPNGAVMLVYDGTLSRWTLVSPSLPDPIDPGSPTALVDDFFSGSTETGEVGALGWSFTSGSVGAQASAQNRPGVILRTSGVTANQVASMYLSTAVSTQQFRFDEFDELFWSLLLPTNGTDFTIRAGVMADVSGNPPAAGIYVERLSSDTSWFGVSRQASTQTRTAALLAQDTAFHTFRVRRIDASNVGFQVDRGAEVTLATNIPGATQALTFGIHIVPTTTTARTFQLDFFSARLLPVSRW